MPARCFGAPPIGRSVWWGVLRIAFTIAASLRSGRFEEEKLE